MKLATNFSIESIDYAGQGNAILGIRDAGKTYTALKAAEELIESGIPIIAYDPVGVWKNLKVGTGKHKGYPVVVAGGEGADIRLTATNAVDIVRAAMKENISLVIDLYSPELIHKSTWIKIVQETVDLLMYENKSYSMRHIFVEEAAEFIPQRIQPQQSKVYASLERLARMGRNARLGMTIINQRAEEVNKAILEICAMCLLHRQIGKNSLKSIQQWLDLRQLDDVADIIKSLPNLSQGQCWIIGQTAQPKLIQIAKRNTAHPDPKNWKDPEIKAATVDVSAFVSKMNQQLHKKEAPKKLTNELKQNADEFQKLREAAQRNSDAYRELQKKCTELQKEIMTLRSALSSIGKIIAHSASKPSVNVEAVNPESIRVHLPMRISVPKQPKPTPIPRSLPAATGTNLGKAARTILNFLGTYENRSFTKAQVAIACGYSASSGGFNNALSELNTAGVLNREGGKLSAVPPLPFEIEPQPYSIETFKSKLGKCEREIYEVLLENPTRAYSKSDLANNTATTYSHESGGFNNSLARLNTLELIVRDRGMIMLNPELLELM